VHGKRIDGLIQLLLPAHVEKHHVMNPEESPFAKTTPNKLPDWQAVERRQTESGENVTPYS
jgi:hypothetical protein